MYGEKYLTLGGIRQVVGIEGKDDGPIMIMLHGGPLTPIIYGHAYRGFYPVLYENAGLVWWDQYGSGRNHVKALDGSIDVEAFARMTVDLVDAVHDMFPDRKIILNGNSFGSYLAMYAAVRRADVVSGVILLGPIWDMKEAVANFENAARNRYTPKERERVEELRQKGGIGFFMYVAETLAEKYTNCAHYKGKEAHDGYMMKWVMRLMTSKDWKMADFTATLKLLSSLKATSTSGKGYDNLWNSLLDIDMTEDYERVGCPLLILQGSEELYVLPAKLQAYADGRDNVTYKKFDYCGHIPTTESFPGMLGEMAAFVKGM